MHHQDRRALAPFINRQLVAPHRQAPQPRPLAQGDVPLIEGRAWRPGQLRIGQVCGQARHEPAKRAVDMAHGVDAARGREAPDTLRWWRRRSVAYAGQMALR